MKNEIYLRTLSAILLALITISSIMLGGLYFKTWLAFFVGLAIFEISEMSKSKEVGFVCVPISIFSIWAFFEHPFNFILLPLFVLVMAKRYNKQLSLYVFCLMVACLYLLWLRDVGAVHKIYWIALVVVTTDVAGFIFGRLIGGIKFASRISPKKTWSGVVAGWIATLLIVFCIHRLKISYISSYDMLTVLAISFAMSFVSQLGDLYESYLKRICQIKDSSSLIPGH